MCIRDSLVIFSHGKESGPKGTKIKLLTEVAQNLGFSTISVDYTTCNDVNQRVDLLKKTLSNHKDTAIVLVGSSMGGYVSTVVASEIKVEAMFLMCPALYLETYPVQFYSPKTSKVEIIHGWKDEVVPFENSIKFGQEIQAKLHLVNDNHRLINSYKFLQQRFDTLLKEVLPRI